MHFAQLQLTHFRNYSQLRAEFSPAINVITGNNGAGKTNVLEAVHFLAMTRGWSRRGEPYALQEDMPYFMVEGEFVESEALRLQCTYMPDRGKKILIDRQALRKMSDHIGRIPLISVLPNDTQLIYGSPSVRRRFMDGFISQYDRKYLDALLRYDKALDQRNALLNLFQERRTWDEEQLLMWDGQLIQTGRYLHQARREFLERFQPIFAEYFQLIVSDRETPSIALESPVEENTPEGWAELFRQSRDKDRYSGRTSAGVHKEDLKFEINGQHVKHFGSQGQQKTFVISLKLTQYELLADRTSKAPVLLLDDIFDKLDLHRLRALARILHEKVDGQVFVTDTSLERTQRVFGEFDRREVQFFAVEGGRFSPVETADQEG